MSTDWQVFLLARHGQRGEGESAVIEGQLKGHVHCIEQDLFAHELNVHLLVIEVACHFAYLPHGVVDKATPLRPIVQRQALLGLILANEAGSTHAWVRELQVLVQIVQPIEKVSHMPSQHGQDSVIAILTHKADKVDAQSIHEFALRYSKYLRIALKITIININYNC